MALVPIVKNNQLIVHRGEHLGRGKFGTVLKGTLRMGDMEEVMDVAVKAPNQNPVDLDIWLQEVHVLGGKKHPNVINYLAINLSGPYIIMEKYSRGSLYDLLGKEEYRGFSRVDKMKLIIGIAKGMEFLHSQEDPIVHRDLKSSNVLLREDFTVVVADFGLKWTGDVKKLGWPNPAYQPPEVALDLMKANTKSDVYSFGIIMWEILTGDKPWGELETPQVYGQLMQQKRPILPEEMPCDWSGWESFVDLMKRCWSEEPEQRPTFTTILQELESLHPQ